MKIYGHSGLGVFGHSGLGVCSDIGGYLDIRGSDVRGYNMTDWPTDRGRF